MSSEISVKGSADDKSDLYKERLSVLHQSEKLSLAPMMEYTDRHFRCMLRLMSKNTLLYSEMVAANALAWEGVEEDDFQVRRFLSQGQMRNEGASILQLGGSDPKQLRIASSMVALDKEKRWDYTAINLNCGCPSPKVSGKGNFGAALMKDAGLVRDLTVAMYEGSNESYPITVKCRIGTDDDDYNSDDALYSSLCRFIDTVAGNGVVDNFQVHARIAILNKSLSPAQNRSVPPLKHHLVHKLARDFPELKISINGGIDSLAEVMNQYEKCPELSGVMVGRALAAAPWHFAMVDKLLYNESGRAEGVVKNRFEMLENFGKHADNEENIWSARKIRRLMLKAIQPLFHGEKNSKRFRIALDDIAGLPKKELESGTKVDSRPVSELILEAAVTHLSDDVLYSTAEESYEQIIQTSGKSSNINLRSDAVREWQERREEQGECQTA